MQLSYTRDHSPGARPPDRHDGDEAAEQLLLSSRQPSRRQVEVILAIALVLLVVCMVSLPVRRRPFAQITAFIPVVDTLLLLADLLTATLLFAQTSVLRSRALLALATGYCYTALMIIPHALSFPGGFSETGLLGADPSTTPWIYFLWHVGLPLSVIAYAWLKGVDSRAPLSVQAVRPAVIASVSGCVVATITLATLVATEARILPIVMTDAIRWVAPQVFWMVLPVLLLVAVAAAAVWQTRRSLLDDWLLLALWAWSLELVLLLGTTTRYSGGWYTGRSVGLLAGVLVLIMLLWETNRLYARLALSVVTRRRERESQSITMNAVAASIAHEVKQPLNAIVLNADAGLMDMARGVTDPQELSSILQAILADGRRAASIVDSIRGMFRKGSAHRSAISVNDLIRETATMMSAELIGHRVRVSLELADDPPTVVADRLQMQHVLLNLFVNAIDAMRTVHERTRVLSVRSSRDDEHMVLVVVQDSGIGIESAMTQRIFEPFFTTKQHGTGMGLSLCRSIVEAHGGDLRLAASSGAGATFHLRLPQTPRAGAGAEQR